MSRRLMILILLVVPLHGCGPRRGLPDMVPIRGTVTFEGKPLEEGTVLYLPKTPGQGRQARGEIQADGSYRLTTLREGDGAQHGDYDIVVIALAPHPGEPPSREEVEKAGGMIRRGYVIPERYTKAETSGLTDVVDENHAGTTDIQLTN